MKVRKAHSISHFSLARQVGSKSDGSRDAMARGQQNQPYLATNKRIPTSCNLKKSKSMQTKAEKKRMGNSFVVLSPNPNAKSQSLNLGLPSFSHKHTAQSHKPRCCLPSSASGCLSGVSGSAASASTNLSAMKRGERVEGNVGNGFSATLSWHICSNTTQLTESIALSEGKDRALE